MTEKVAGIAFPAQAGMNRGETMATEKVKGVPRAGGDEPGGMVWIKDRNLRAQRRRGLTVVLERGALGYFAFPAQAGMNRPDR